MWRNPICKRLPRKKSSFKLLRATRKVVCSRNHVCWETTAQLAARTVTRGKIHYENSKETWDCEGSFEAERGELSSVLTLSASIIKLFNERFVMAFKSSACWKSKKTFASAASAQWCKQYISLSVSKASSSLRILFFALVRLLPSERKIICSIYFPLAASYPCAFPRSSSSSMLNVAATYYQLLFLSAQLGYDGSLSFVNKF